MCVYVRVATKIVATRTKISNAKMGVLSLNARSPRVEEEETESRHESTRNP
jgi:hypothetical protein